MQLAFDLGAESVMGNHEEKALRWRKHEKKRQQDPTHYKNPMAEVNESRLQQWSKISHENWEWISSWPVFSHISDTWTAVHGGCLPGIAIEDQKPNELMRMRYVKSIGLISGDTKYKMAQLSDAGEAPLPSDTNESVHHWTELWSGPRNIVYGHYTRDDIHVTEGPAWTLGIDTACVHGKFLTAAIFHPGKHPGFETVQVTAKQTYVERRPWNDSME